MKYSALVIASLLGAAFVAAPSEAQVTPSELDRASERLQELQQQRVRDQAETFERRSRRPPSGQSALETVPPPHADMSCAAIREVRLAGVTRYDPADFARILAPLKGACVGVAAIDTALRAISNRKRDVLRSGIDSLWIEIGEKESPVYLITNGEVDRMRVLVDPVEAIDLYCEHVLLNRLEPFDFHQFSRPLD